MKSAVVFLICLVPVLLNAKNQISADYVKRLEGQVKASPTNLQLKLKLAQTYLGIRDYDKALATYKEANDPQNVEALEGIVSILQIKKDNLELVRALELLLQLKPKIPKYLSQLGQAYWAIDNHAKAIENLNASIQIAPQYEKAYEILMDLHDAREDLGEADAVLRMALQQFGRQEKYLSRVCKYKALLNYYQDAKNLCQEAVLKEPKRAENHVYMGLSYRYTENPQQAQKILITTAEKFRSSELAQFYGGQSSDEIKNWEQSIKFYQNGIRANPKSARCFSGLGKALYELKKYKESLAAFSKACTYDNKVDKEIRTYSGYLRGRKIDEWYYKYRDMAEQCPLLRSKEPKKLTK